MLLFQRSENDVVDDVVVVAAVVVVLVDDGINQEVDLKFLMCHGKRLTK